MARLNENENENENESTDSRRDGLFAGGRYNTYKILKQAFATGGTIRAPGSGGRYPGYERMGGWDAENRGWIYLREFVELKRDWFDELYELSKGIWNGWDLASPEGTERLNRALQDIIDAAGEREDRFAECFHQQDAEGCISYWMAMLRLDPARQPATYQLIRMARKLGEMIVMCLKDRFNADRPSQICPAIVPMFDPPRTASYPAGHALQSYLISFLLRRVMRDFPQSPRPSESSWNDDTNRHQGLFALARRVADNRVIAGVHYDIDNEAGFRIALKIDDWFEEWSSSNTTGFEQLRALLDAARAEFPQYN